MTGRDLREWGLIAGMSQAKIAKVCGVTERTVRRWEQDTDADIPDTAADILAKMVKERPDIPDINRTFVPDKADIPDIERTRPDIPVTIEEAAEVIRRVR